MKLRRHQLAYLSAAGWREMLRRPMEEGDACHLREWAQRSWPLVVARQEQNQEPGHIVLGWPIPRAWSGARKSLQVPAKLVGWFDEFPLADEVCPLLPRPARKAVEMLLRGLARLGTRPHVFGSYGWELLTGLAYVHHASDLDLWMRVNDLQHADSVVRVLQSCEPGALRIDGELMFPHGAAVAWREYAAWRDGRPGGLLVKRVDAVSVEHAIALPAWCEGVAV